MLRISIIIPAYNVSKLLIRCVESCEKQDINVEDFEIIIVNDGSQDDTYKIALDLKKAFSNVKVLTQSNQGQSVARNKALEIAQGQYIAFVDSDDWLEENTLNKLLVLAENNKLDILYFLMNVQNKDGSWLHTSLITFEENHIYTGEYTMIHANPAGACTSRLFRRKFLIDNNLHFYPGIIHQDAELTTRAFSLAKRVMFVNIAAYNYAYNFESTTRTIRYAKLKKNIFDDLIIARNIKEFAARQPNLSKRLKDYLYKDANSIYISTFLKIFMNKDHKIKAFINDFIIESKKYKMLPLRGCSLSWKTTSLIPMLNIYSRINTHVRKIK